jgi:hypothetical protein
LIIIPNFNFQRSREALSFGCPSGESFTAKLLNKQILMRIKQNVNAIFIGILNNLTNDLDIGIVVDSLLRLHSLPRTVQPNYIHPPMLEIVKIVIGEAVVGIEVGEIRMERIDFIHCIDSMIDCVSIILIHKHGVVGINFDRSEQANQ